MIWAAAIVLLRGTLAWLLITSAVQKAVASSEFEALLDTRVGWLGSSRARRATWLLVTVEVAISIALLITPFAALSLVAAGVLFATFAAITGTWLAGGIDGDCGCGGLMPIDTVSIGHVLLNAGLGAVASGTGGVMLLLSEGSHVGIEIESVLVLAPLPTLIFARTARQLIDNNRALREVDLAHAGEWG